jgi:ATP/maltotriose-dependent transcriptional regulator MalT
MGHAHNRYDKLGVNGRPEAVAWAYQLALIEG